MSNISLNGVVFPSPSVARQTQQFNSSSPVFSSPINCGTSTFKNYTQSTSSAVGIQFPSPYYTPSPIRDPSNLYINSGLPAMPSAAGYQIPSIIMSSRCNEAGNEQPQMPSVWQQNVPPTLPWAIPGQSQSNLVHFTATTVAAVSNTLRQGSTRSPSSLSSLSHQQVILGRSTPRRSPRKRRCNFSQENQHESKIFIHEDRIAAGMKGLQLQPSYNSDFKTANASPASNDAWFVEKAVISDDDSMGEEDPETGEADTEMEPKLRFSNELEMGLKNKDILPQLIREEINKSQMQIVLWKPPGDHIRNIVNSYQLNNEPSNGKFLVERKPESVSPNVWSIPAGEYNEETDFSLIDSSNKRSSPKNPIDTDLHSSNFDLNINNPFNYSQQMGASSTVCNLTNSVPSCNNNTGTNSTQRSLKFDFSIGPDFWNQGNKGNDFVACSTPKDYSSDGLNGFSSSKVEEISSLKTEETLVPVVLNNGPMAQSQDSANLTVFDFIDDDMDL